MAVAIEPIVNGESGLSVRQKLNLLLAAVNNGASIEYVDAKVEELNEWIEGSVQPLIEETERLAEQITAEQQERLEEAIRASADARAMRDRIRELAQYAAEQGYHDFEAREEMRRQLTAEAGRYAAHFDERIIVAASETAAVAQRVTQLSTENDRLNSLILNVETSLTDQVSSLAQSISSLAVGTNTQFDYANIWYFDTSAEGWTGYPLPPTVSTDGFLRPANNGEYVQSPAVSVNGNTYRQIRARLRRVGAPVWRGNVWWSNNATPDQVAAEPGWADDRASLTIEANWNGSVPLLRLDLATNTATDYIEIDWVAIGRPAPGASSAEVSELRRAFITEGEAVAERFETLGAELTTLDGKATGTAEAVDALTTRVTETEEGLELAASRISGLNLALDDKAEVDVVDQLAARVEELDNGGTAAQAEATRALRIALRDVALEALQAGSRAWTDNRQTVDIIAEASQSLNTRIDLTDAGLTAVAEDVTLLKLQVPGLATVSALQALRTTVTTIDGRVTAQGDQITQIQADLPGLATSSALQALGVRVTEAEGKVTSQGQAITSLQSALDQKANASAVTTLTTRVSTAESTLGDHNSRIIGVGQRVADNEDDIIAVSDALTALDTTVGRFSASGRFRITTESTPTGSTARIGLRVAASAGAGTPTGAAAMFLEARSNGNSVVVIQSARVNINSNFIVDEQGFVTIRSGTSGGRMVQTNEVVSVYDDSGTLRVRMGRLS